MMDTKSKNGVIIGASKDQEWLLPWWWMNFHLHNTLPVAFINFGGMSEKALNWCAKRGEVISFEEPINSIAPKEKIDPERAKIWEATHSDVWSVRQSWFKKPLALLKSPFQRTMWMDLDCQTLGPIESLFDLLIDGSIALVAEAEWSQELNRKKGHLLPGEIMYNSGVLLYDRNSSIIKEWAKQSLERSDSFFGDQQLLSRILFTEKIPVVSLEPIYNWPMDNGLNPKAVVLHWSGHFKEYVKIQIRELKEKCFIDLSF